jgi:hypothetical protein
LIFIHSRSVTVKIQIKQESPGNLASHSSGRGWRWNLVINPSLNTVLRQVCKLFDHCPHCEARSRYKSSHLAVSSNRHKDLQHNIKSACACVSPPITDQKARICGNISTSWSWTHTFCIVFSCKLFFRDTHAQVLRKMPYIPQLTRLFANYGPRRKGQVAHSTYLPMTY